MRTPFTSFALALAVLACTALATAQTVNPPGSFSTAKKRALEVVYQGHHETFYCGCGFNDAKELDASTCGYTPRNDNIRAHRIEWEHVIPASRFGRTRTCWTEPASFEDCLKRGCAHIGGRKCCAKVDAQFKAMEADLQNLRPAVGELNADRSDNPFGEIGGEPREYGACDFEVQGGVAEPRAAGRGEIGRTYLYFHREWGMSLETAERATFEQWNREDPPDAWEIERNNRIRTIQGTGNFFVENHSGVGTDGACIPRSECCRVCGKSQACGDSCIQRSATCRKGRGCACQATEVCE